MTCEVCNQETASVRVGTADFCAVCGARDGKRQAGAVRTLDLRPTAAQSKDPEPAPAPVKTKQPEAHVLHRRATVAKGGVLDLRNAKPKIAKKVVPRVAVEHEPTGPVTREPAPVHHTDITAPAKERLSRFEDRIQHAKATPRSTAISRFTSQGSTKPDQEKPAEEAKSSLPAAAVTHHQALSELIKRLPEVKPAMPEPGSRVARYAAGMAAIAILGGYIWVHNYPKLAIQTAGGKAGLSASLPGYMPSSFNLASTKTAPGLVTLNFSSPNQSQPLTIAQHSTSWDSHSLLDNYVAKQSSDYTAVQGQGLTVYMFNENEAAWVNHGVWYTISGATRLSREQLLKIAYSL